MPKYIGDWLLATKLSETYVQYSTVLDKFKTNTSGFQSRAHPEGWCNEGPVYDTRTWNKIFLEWFGNKQYSIKRWYNNLHWWAEQQGGREISMPHYIPWWNIKLPDDASWQIDKVAFTESLY